MADANNYSTLEVAAQPHNAAAKYSYAGGDGLQVVRDDSGKEYVPPPSSPPLQTDHHHHAGAGKGQGGPPPTQQDFSHAHDKPLPVARPWWKKKRFFVTGIVVLVVVAAAVGAALGVTLSGSDGDGGSGDSGAVSGGSGSDAPNASLSDSLMERHIAAVGLQDGSTNRTWVFYQNSDGKIVRSGATSPQGPWTTSETGSNGKNGSVLAAAVSRPGFPLQIHVFYIGDDDVIHDTLYRESTGSWDHGKLSDEGYTVFPNSSITAMYNQCRFCANTTIIAFQDINGFVQVGNLTSSGWSLSQLGNGMQPAVGTGLALQPFYRANTSDQVNLYYQKDGELNMTLAAYQESHPENSDPGWRFNANVHGAFPFGSPIAAASSYSNITTGQESWIQLLSLAPAGVRVSTWEGTIKSWSTRFASPSTMANSTANEKVYGRLAMTATGGAFAVTQVGDETPKIETWQLQDDFTSWDAAGSIDAW